MGMKSYQSSGTFTKRFVAMKHSVEMVKALKYKLRMFGIQIMDTKIFGDYPNLY